jgi:hypothetical protein
MVKSRDIFNWDNAAVLGVAALALAAVLSFDTQDPKNWVFNNK